MKLDRVDLYKYFGVKRPKGAEGYLNIYLWEVSKEYSPKRIRPAMLVIAGGGYHCRSDREREPIALTYLKDGYNAFTLEYSVSPVKYPACLIEGCMAVAYIRENAKNLNIDKNKIAVIGFSAGGHLASMLATITGEKEVKEVLSLPQSKIKPNAVVLSYPVVNLLINAHKGSAKNLCGEDEKLKERLSIEKRVTKNSVPAFIWTTVNDGTVPSENSLMLACAYKEKGVPFELHVFSNGQHGLSLSNSEVNTVNVPVQEWVKLSKTWLREMGFSFTDKK